MSILWFIFVITTCFSEVISSGFLVTAPSIFFTKTKERICLSIHDNFAHTTPVNIALTKVETNEVIASVDDFVKGNASCVLFNVPHINEDKAKLRVKFDRNGSEDGVPNLSEQTVTIKQDPLITIVSNDKPIYRPGEVVKFRVLRLTHHLKVFHDRLAKVWIEGPNGIILEQWMNVEHNNGLAQFEFPLSEESLIGDWLIKVQNNVHQSNILEEKIFTVKEFSLPSFDVMIKQPKEILADTDNIKIEVCAKFSYGAPVKGIVKIEMKLKTNKNYVTAAQDTTTPRIYYELTLDPWTGCALVNVPERDVINRNPFAKTLKIAAVVIEAGSQKTEKSTSFVNILRQAYQLKFHCSEYFKPGLPYKGKVRVLSASGEPTIAVDFPVEVCMKEGSAYSNVAIDCWNYTTDYSSEVTFTLPPRPRSTNYITITARTLNYQTKYYEDPSWKLMMHHPSATQHLKSWYSPSNSFIEVSTVSPVMCYTEHDLHVQYTVDSFNSSTPSFFYLIESRGDILRIGTAKPNSEKLVTGDMDGFPPSRAFILHMLVTPDMAPESRVVVYYARTDGEIIAASTILPVEKCFSNKVRTRWSAKEVEPGANISLSINAHASSLCAVNIVDTMVKKLNTDNKMFDGETVWQKLEHYKTPSQTDEDFKYCKNKIDEKPPLDYDLRRKKRWLMYPQSVNVDAITAFYDAGITVLTDLKIKTKPCIEGYDNLNDLYTMRTSFDIRGPIALMNIAPPAFSPGSISVNHHDRTAKPKSAANSVRNFFPESWLWSLVSVSKEGETTLETFAPHSITSWESSVFCTHNDVGFGMADPGSFVTYLPFFLTVDLPKSFVKTEIPTINVTVYNYLGHSLPVKVSIKTYDGLKVTSPVEISNCITELSPVPFYFTITASSTGSFNISVTAEVLEELENCRPAVYKGIKDTIVKPINVLAEGFKVTKTYSDLLCGNDELRSMWDLSYSNESNIIIGTERAYVTITPGLLGPALKGLGDFLELPTGCGEQNMIRLAPNIQMLRYLNAFEIPNGEMMKQIALTNIKKGYQRQLLYRHHNGGYSAFGNSDGTPSIWLTAFVLSSLGQAANYVTIDMKTLNQTLDWIVSKQLENGCFPQIGQLFQAKELSGGLSNKDSPPALTAFIIASLYKSGLPIPESVARNAKFCLMRSNSDVYSLALVTYAFAILDSTSDQSNQYLNRLMQAAKRDQDLIRWEGGTLALNVEIAGYAVLSLIKIGGEENMITAHSIVRMLSMLRNYKGGFVSTQDTVVGLEALTSFAMAIPKTNVTSLLVHVDEQGINGGKPNMFSIDSNNKDLQTHYKLNKLPTKVNVYTRGEGCALVQATLKYNIEKNLNNIAFNVVTLIKPVTVIDPCSTLNTKVCVNYTLPEGVSNMVIIDVNFGSGYKPDYGSLKEALSISEIQRWEEDDVNNKLIFYLDKVESTSRCFDFNLIKVYIVENPAPMLITATDYYNPELTVSYKEDISCKNVPSDENNSLESNEDNFNNVDFELNLPEGNEGPHPVYAAPP